MTLPELTPEKYNPTVEFCNNILQHMHCNTNENYITYAIGILHKKSYMIFKNTFSSVIVPKILIKYLLHASSDSLDHVGATKLYHLLKRLYYFQGMWEENTPIC